MGTLYLWVRSLYRIDVVELSTPYHWLSLLSGGGKIRLIDLSLDYPGVSQLPDTPPRRPEAGWHWSYRSESEMDALYGMIIFDAERPEFWRWLPFSFERGQPAETFSESPPYAGGWQVTGSYWLILTVVAILPGWQMLALLARRRRTGRGLCRRCGYDLRASADRCPECGTLRFGVVASSIAPGTQSGP